MASPSGAPCALLSCTNTGATLRCSRCKSVAYCSRECQRAAWGPVHKEECALALSSRKPISFAEGSPGPDAELAAMSSRVTSRGVRPSDRNEFLRRVRSLIRAGADPTIDCRMYPRGTSDEVIALLSALQPDRTHIGPRPNAHLGSSLLSYALQEADMELLELIEQETYEPLAPLLNSGRLLDGGLVISTGLYHAISSASLQSIELALRQGADPNQRCRVAQDAIGKTWLVPSLLLICETMTELNVYTKPETVEAMIRTLVAAGADVDATASDGSTSLFQLLRRTVVDLESPPGITKAHAHEVDLHMVRVLLELGADVNRVTNVPDLEVKMLRPIDCVATIISFAIQIMKTPIEFSRLQPLYELLLAHGCDFMPRAHTIRWTGNVFTDYLYQSLHTANYPLLRFAFQRAGVDPNAVSPGVGEPYLVHAAECGE